MLVSSPKESLDRIKDLNIRLEASMEKTLIQFFHSINDEEKDCAFVRAIKK